MTQNQTVTRTGTLESKFWKVTLILLAALLIFTGATYVPFLLADTLKLEYFASIGIGFVLFLVGIAIMLYLSSKKVIT